MSTVNRNCRIFNIYLMGVQISTFVACILSHHGGLQLALDPSHLATGSVPALLTPRPHIDCSYICRALFDTRRKSCALRSLNWPMPSSRSSRKPPMRTRFSDTTSRPALATSTRTWYKQSLEICIFVAIHPAASLTTASKAFMVVMRFTQLHASTPNHEAGARLL